MTGAMEPKQVAQQMKKIMKKYDVPGNHNFRNWLRGVIAYYGSDKKESEADQIRDIEIYTKSKTDYMKAKSAKVRKARTRKKQSIREKRKGRS